MTLKEFAADQAKAKANKYGAKKVVIDGITFASTLEGARYLELKDMERKEFVCNIRTQVKYVLVPKSKGFREVVYIADFVYMTADGEVIEDTKGKITATFVMKRKIMANLGHKIRLVGKEKIGAGYFELARDIRESGIEYSTR